MMAATPIAACNGATDRPWPKAMVAVVRSLQRLGRIGSALSGNSVRSRSSWPSFFRKACCVGLPSDSAMRAAPIFDE